MRLAVKHVNGKVFVGGLEDYAHEPAPLDLVADYDLDGRPAGSRPLDPPIDGLRAVGHAPAPHFRRPNSASRSASASPSDGFRLRAVG